MSVHFAPQETGGSEIFQTALNFDKWMTDQKQAVLHNQLMQSQVQEQAARTELVKTEAEKNRQQLGEFQDTSTQRRALLDAQVSGAQNTSSAEGSRAAILKNQENRIPITNANDDELMKAAAAKAKTELDSLGVDNATRKLRLLQMTPEFFATLKKTQAETDQIQQHTALLKQQLDGVQQDIVNKNVDQAAKIVEQRARGEITQQDFESLKKVDTPFAKYLQPYSGQETGPKTLDQFRTDVAKKALAAAGTVTDPNEQQKLMNLMSTMVEPGGVPTMTPATMFPGTQVEQTPAKPGRSIAPVQEAFTQGFGAMFNANKKKNVDVSQPGTGTSIGDALNKSTTKPTGQQSTGSEVTDLLSKVNEHIGNYPDLATKTYVSNEGEKTVNDFFAKLPRDYRYVVKPGGEIMDEQAYNENQKKGFLEKLGTGIVEDTNPLNNVNADVLGLFKANMIRDKSATVAQEARYRAALSLMAKAHRQDPEDLRLTRPAEDPNTPKIKATAFDLLKNLKVGPSGITPEQTASIWAIARHY